jgi:ribosomal protein S18 acetylase RimI-like enzyme
MPEQLKYLAWDSQFFDKKVGSLHVHTSKALVESLKYADLNRYELLYVFSPFAIGEPLIGKYFFCDAGGHIKYIKYLNSLSPKANIPIPEIIEYRQNSLARELLKLFFLSGHQSRFKIDASLPKNSFESLYETWLEKTIDNWPTTAIYLYHVDDEIAGLITAEWQTFKCTIGHLAVEPSHQGQGIATKLINHVQYVSMTREVKSIETKTQLSNLNARAFYLKNSFTEQDRSFLYHAHNLMQ